MRARDPYTRERDVAQRCETVRLARAKKREQEPHAAVRACRSRGRDVVHADHVCATLSLVDRKWLEQMLDGRRFIKQDPQRSKKPLMELSLDYEERGRCVTTYKGPEFHNALH